MCCLCVSVPSYEHKYKEARGRSSWIKEQVLRQSLDHHLHPLLNSLPKLLFLLDPPKQNASYPPFTHETLDSIEARFDEVVRVQLWSPLLYHVNPTLIGH